eukprot:TRINITY_DN2473_c0_g1_i1.p1 TRINITY_DN2473_c0_g1~~TRINITY_DN2473_c0_g1_i1.p1  ORF type:complete len:281 (+),score=63.39 TRINITY_DN2473_c0_g1_i1:46-888(+)
MSIVDSGTLVLNPAISTGNDFIDISEPMSLSAPQRIIFLDWDNTLFPSSELLTRDLDPTFWEDEQRVSLFKDEVERVDKSASNLLSFIVSLNITVHIITNAEYDWMEFCFNGFMHQTFQIIKENSIPIFYANADENLDGGILAKFFAFHDVLWEENIDILRLSDTEKSYRIMFSTSNTSSPHILHQPLHLPSNNNRGLVNLISVGDAFHDRGGLSLVAQRLTRGSLVKSILVIAQPSIDDLVFQHEHLMTILEELFNSSSSLDKHYRRTYNGLIFDDFNK